MHIRPVGNYVIVQPVEGKELKTADGLLMPDLQVDVPSEGIVIAVNVESSDSQIQMGMLVGYNKYAGEKTFVENKEVLVLEKADIKYIREA